jgi:glyoxylase-like metal-dependent hydrolase (beta-lactamase superfamily II)
MRGGALRASSVLARRDGEIAVIDTGMAHHAASLAAALEQEGVAPGEVTLVLNTHAHVDHSHNNALFANARIYCSRRDREWTCAMQATLARASSPSLDHVLPFFPGMASATYSAKVVRKILALEKLLWDESRLRLDARTIWSEEAGPPPGISIIETPGHTPHHMSFVIQTGGRPVLVCGDALLHRDDLAAPAAGMLLWDPSAYHASLDRIRAFSGLVVPGHDEPFDNVPDQDAVSSPRAARERPRT